MGVSEGIIERHPGREIVRCGIGHTERRRRRRGIGIQVAENRRRGGRLWRDRTGRQRDAADRARNVAVRIGLVALQQGSAAIADLTKIVDLELTGTGVGDRAVFGRRLQGPP